MPNECRMSKLVFHSGHLRKVQRSDKFNLTTPAKLTVIFNNDLFFKKSHRAERVGAIAEF